MRMAAAVAESTTAAAEAARAAAQVRIPNTSERIFMQE